MTQADDATSLYGVLGSRVDNANKDDKNGPTTTVTASIETIDNDRPAGGAGGRNGMPMP